MGSNYEKIFYKDYEQLFDKNNKLSAELRHVKYEHQILVQRYNETEQKKDEIQNINLVLQNSLKEAQKEIDRLRGLLNIDGTNSGTPTSKTPIYKKKVIPNSREKSGKARGGQDGHKKRVLKRFKDDEINETRLHTPSKCPKCQHVFDTDGHEKTGTIEKDELDYKVIVVKTRHVFDIYKCPCCGKKVHQEIPNNLKEENQYGPQVQQGERIKIMKQFGLVIVFLSTISQI